MAAARREQACSQPLRPQAGCRGAPGITTCKACGPSQREAAVELCLAAVVLVAAAAVRLPGLAEVPPGLHFDEAFNALDALSVVRGARPLFFEGNFGREPLFIYLLAALFSVAKPSPAAVRLLPALAGAVGAALTYCLARALQEERTGALAAGLVQAFLPWDLHFSRYGLRVEFLPLLCSAALLCLVLGWRRWRSRWFVAAGACLGLSLYSYMAARVFPLVVLIWWLQVRRACGHGKHMLICFAVAVAVFLPLGVYFVRHPASFAQRPSQVILKGSPAELVAQVGRNCLAWGKAFFWRGDENPRNNLPGAPALTPWLAFPWAIGLCAALRQPLEPFASLPLYWMAIMLLPSVGTDYAPNFQRAIGAVPAICLLVGRGIGLLRQALERLLRRRSLASAAVAALLAGHAAQATYQYFWEWGRDNALYYAFDQGLLEIGLYMRSRAARGEPTYLSPVRPDHATLHFAMRGVGKPVTFDGRHVFVLPSPGAEVANYIFLVAEDVDGPRNLQKRCSGASLVRVFRDRVGQVYAEAWQVEPGGCEGARAPLPVRANWANGVTLLGLGIQAPPNLEGAVVVESHWRAVFPLSEDLTLFLHLIGPLNPATGTPLWSGADSMPGSGSYPTSRWAPGEVVIDRRLLLVPEGLPDGRYYLEVGWYEWRSGKRRELAGLEPGADSLVIPWFSVRSGRRVLILGR